MNTTKLANDFFKLSEEMKVLVANQNYELAAQNRDSTRQILEELGYDRASRLVEVGQVGRDREALFVKTFLRAEKLSQILGE